MSQKTGILFLIETIKIKIGNAYEYIQTRSTPSIKIQDKFLNAIIK